MTAVVAVHNHVMLLQLKAMMDCGQQCQQPHPVNVYSTYIDS
jgi:hypothetical protein